MSVGKTVVAGTMPEIVDGDHAGEGGEAKRPLNDGSRRGIGGGSNGGLWRRVVGEEIERADEFLSGGRREACAFGEGEVLVANVAGGEGRGGEDEGEEEKRELCHCKREVKSVETRLKLRQRHYL